MKAQTYFVMIPIAEIENARKRMVIHNPVFSELGTMDIRDDQDVTQYWGMHGQLNLKEISDLKSIPGVSCIETHTTTIAARSAVSEAFRNLVNANASNTQFQIDLEETLTGLTGFVRESGQTVRGKIDTWLAGQNLSIYEGEEDD